ncbi:MAG: hypothetical protein GY774_17575 [Planctomycetes bacterium]|nr:hypothetical protein [Planctomycetota bacterium]
MSTKYKHGDRVPTPILIKRLRELADAATIQGRNSGAFEREFTIRIPAELDRDADLVLSEVARRLSEWQDEQDHAAVWFD